MCWFFGAAVTAGQAATAWVTLAATAASVGAQRAQAATASRIAQVNAQTERFKQESAVKEGLLEEDIHRQKVRQIIGAQTAAMGASGGVVGAGSFGSILDDAAAMGEFDALTVRANAARQAWGLGRQALSQELQADVARRAGRAGVAGSLLSGGAQLAGVFRS